MSVLEKVRLIKSAVKGKKREFPKIRIRLKHLIFIRFAGIVDESFSLILIPDFDS